MKTVGRVVKCSHHLASMVRTIPVAGWQSLPFCIQRTQPCVTVRWFSSHHGFISSAQCVPTANEDTCRPSGTSAPAPRHVHSVAPALMKSAASVYSDLQQDGSWNLSVSRSSRGSGRRGVNPRDSRSFNLKQHGSDRATSDERGSNREKQGGASTASESANAGSSWSDSRRQEKNSHSKATASVALDEEDDWEWDAGSLPVIHRNASSNGASFNRNGSSDAGSFNGNGRSSGGSFNRHERRTGGNVDMNGSFNGSDRRWGQKHAGGGMQRPGGRFKVGNDGQFGERERAERRYKRRSNAQFDEREGVATQSWDEEGGRGSRESRPAGYTLRDEMVGEVLYGVSPVLNALRFKRREIHALYHQQSMDMSKRKDAKAAQTILELAEQSGVVIKPADKHQLNLLADNRPHQGFVLDVEPMQCEPMDVLPPATDFTSKGQCPVWLALDEVVDPQNLGAVIRSAYCLGASGVLACSKNCAPLSAVVSKASSGVLEAMPVHSCKVLMRTLHDAAAKGWEVMGTSLDKSATRLRQLQVTKPTILVMGNEGHGLRTNVRRACTSMVRIDTGVAQPAVHVVDSLNVSVATGIILHHLVLSASISSDTASNSVDIAVDARASGGSRTCVESAAADASDATHATVK